MKRFACVLILILAGVGGLAAQGKRDSLIAQAKDEFDAGRRIQLLIAALNPVYGPPAGQWGDGVQALAQTLLDEGQPATATIWLRWAARLLPSLEPDTVQYTPQVGAAIRAARDFVNGTRSPADSLVSTSWLWSSTPGTPGASIQVDSATTHPLQVSVDNAPPIGRGGRLEVGPGSHEFRISATGYDSIRVTREALPGTTSLLRIRLVALRPQVAAAQQPNRTSTTVPTAKKKKFPWLLAGLGAAGAGAAVLLLGGGGDEGSSSAGTGGITFTFPDQ